MTLHEQIKSNSKVFHNADKARFIFELQTGKRHNKMAALLAKTGRCDNAAWEHAMMAASMAERISEL